MKMQLEVGQYGAKKMESAVIKCVHDLEKIVFQEEGMDFEAVKCKKCGWWG